METSSSHGLECLIGRFFAAENARDWHAYAGFLHPQVEWTLVNGGLERRIEGREEYLRVIESAYAGDATTFRCVQTMSDHRRDRIAAVLVNEVGDRSLDVFDIEEGLIRREWEFLLGRS